MKNIHLERRVIRAKDDNEQAVNDLINEIENLESVIHEKDLEIQQLEEQIKDMKEASK